MLLLHADLQNNCQAPLPCLALHAPCESADGPTCPCALSCSLEQPIAATYLPSNWATMSATRTISVQPTKSVAQQQSSQPAARSPQPASLRSVQGPDSSAFYTNLFPPLDSTQP